MTKRKIRVVHLTSAHPRNDIRIAIKMCSSLAIAGYDVSLVVADNEGDEAVHGYKIYDVGKSKGRVARIAVTTNKVFKKAISLNADIYHLHDPELLLYAKKLQKYGKVIFDSHEDVPKQILCKPYLNKHLLKLVSFVYNKFEKLVCSELDYIVTATPFIRDIFLKINKNTIDINNYPILSELYIKQKTNKKNQICYVGGLTNARGFYQLIDAINKSKSNTKLVVAGFLNESQKEIIENPKSSSRILQFGFLNRSNVAKLMGESIAGIVSFLPEPNHINAQPNKMFEYMSASLPVIASSFPLWREIVENNECGICVDPLNSNEIAKAIDWLYNHPEKATEMGKNGRKAVETKYNWEQEKIKLFKVYKTVLF